MAARAWSREDEATLHREYSRMSTRDICLLLDRTYKAIKSRAKLRGLIKGTRKAWTPAEDAILRGLYAATDTKEIAKRFGCKVTQVYQRAKRLGLEKDADVMHAMNVRLGNRLAELGAGNRFRKGQVPPNKGLRRPGWHAGRMRDTQFKPGQRVYNQRNVGDTRLVDGYLYTKISETACVPWTRNWKQTHYLLWEQAHGPIPSGHKVRFKDGDRTNIVMENLELITDGDLMLENTIHNFPPELKQVIQLTGALKRKIRNRSNAKEQTLRSA